MKTRTNFIFILLMFGVMIVCADLIPSRSAPQQKYAGDLSLKQRQAIELSISTNATSSGFFSPGALPDKADFKTGEQVHVGTVMTNLANESVTVCAFSNPFYQNRLELLRDGHPVAYTKQIAEVVHQSDIDLCEFTRHSDIVELKPNLHVRVPSIELQEWYGVLMPGHYVLTLKRTFACCADGKLNSSNEISFDVTHANESGTSSEGSK